MNKETKSGLGLKYDKPTDFYNIETFNENFRKLETAISDTDITMNDENIDVVADGKKLNVVLSELRSEDKKLWQELNGYVARHKVANDNIQKSIND